MDEQSRTRGRDWVSTVQGAYFLATGLWPLLHMKSFLKVTGPKTDLWLVKTVGLTIAAIGAGLLFKRRNTSRDTDIVAFLSAAALAGVDLNYVGKGRIPPVYLLDVPPELFFAAAAAKRLISADGEAAA